MRLLSSPHLSSYLQLALLLSLLSSFSSFSDAFVIPTATSRHAHKKQGLIDTHIGSGKINSYSYPHSHINLNTHMNNHNAGGDNTSDQEINTDQQGEDRPNYYSSTSAKASAKFLPTLCLSLALFFSPFNTQPAHADFGPSSKAVSQPIPGLTTPSIQEKDIGGKKLTQVIGSSLDESRLADFSRQLDGIIEQLKERQQNAAADDTSGALYSTTEYEDQINSAITLQEQIAGREKLLEQLEQQPYWFNYLAAFIASMASTTVMHPIDTIKTRLMLESEPEYGPDDQDENEEDEYNTDFPLPDLTEVSSSEDPSLLVSSSTGEEAAAVATVEYLSSQPSTATTSSTFSTSTTSTYNSSELQQELIEASATATALLAQEEDKVEEKVWDAVPLHHHSSSTDETETILHEEAELQEYAGSTPPLQLLPTTKNLEKQKESAWETITGLYVGLTGNLLKEGPPFALYLGVYESVKYSLLPTIPGPEFLLFVYLLAGAAGELVGSTIRAPAEAVKSLVQSKAADSAMDAGKMILLRPEGRANVVRAWSASIWRDVPFGAIQLAMFELIKAYILNNPNIDFDSSTLSAEALIGAFAGGCGAFITNPADIVTTRIITQSTDEEGGDKPLGFVAMGQQIYSEGGWEAFFTGWEARVLYWAPAISLFLTCYCTVRQNAIRYDIFG